MKILFLVLLLLPFINAKKLPKNTLADWSYNELVNYGSLCDTEVVTVQIGHGEISSKKRWYCRKTPSLEVCDAHLCDPDDSCEINHENVMVNKNKITNIVLPAESAVYEVHYGHLDRDYKTTITVKNNVPLGYLASSVIKNLMTHSYQYLYLIYNFEKMTNYFPNMSKFFRAKMNSVEELRDKIVEYVQQKHETVEQLDIENCPDYNCILMKKGLSDPVPMPLNGVKDIADALTIAFKNDAKLVVDFTNIVSLSNEGQYEDSELSEFVGHDLTFAVREQMKTLQNMISTYDQITTGSNDDSLASYLFDQLM